MERLSTGAPAGNAAEALSLIPTGTFVLTASHDDCRSGALVKWVQRCAEDPPMVVVALRKGHPIEPLIRDSHGFCLNLLRSEDVVLRRKFECSHAHGEDPFISLPSSRAPSGSPLLLRALAYIDCELTRHLDIESEYEIYIGLVKQAKLLHLGSALDARRLPELAIKASA